MQGTLEKVWNIDLSTSKILSEFKDWLGAETTSESWTNLWNFIISSGLRSFGLTGRWVLLEFCLMQSLKIRSSFKAGGDINHWGILYFLGWMYSGVSLAKAEKKISNYYQYLWIKCNKDFFK